MSSMVSSNATIEGAASGQASNNNGRGGAGRGDGAVASAAIGLSLLAGVAINQMRPAAQDSAPQAAISPAVADPHVASMWDFREDRRAETRDLWVADQFTYREDHRASRPAPAARPAA